MAADYDLDVGHADGPIRGQDEDLKGSHINWIHIRAEQFSISRQGVLKMKKYKWTSLQDRDIEMGSRHNDYPSHFKSIECYDSNSLQNFQ